MLPVELLRLLLFVVLLVVSVLLEIDEQVAFDDAMFVFAVPFVLSLVVVLVVLQPHNAVASAAAAISGTLCIPFINRPPKLPSIDGFRPPQRWTGAVTYFKTRSRYTAESGRVDVPVGTAHEYARRPL
ncbi:MAG TPA: hypothetical protein VLU46_12225 [Thermoanaerobaculia bacterium]|nr:hypothetical protein [Thermoanaerobaculia bacterium]